MILFVLIERWETKRRTLRQILIGSGGDGASKAGGRDSRKLERAARVMDRGARLLRIERSYWDKLDRKLALMGEKADGRETVTLILVRSALVALPALALPFVWGGWWRGVFYPLAAAGLTSMELRALDKKYDQWQKSLEKDIPQVIDRVRICFAGGRNYLSALRQAQAAGGQAISAALGRLINDIQTVGANSAFRLFSESFDLPAIHRLSSALMLAIESGYEAAEAYFVSIDGELTALREEAARTLLRARPEKVYRLYAMLFALAIAALILKGWEILGQVGAMFGAA